MLRLTFVAMALALFVLPSAFAQGMLTAPRESTVSVVDVKLGSHITDSFVVPVPKTRFRPIDTIIVVIETAVQGGEAVPGTLGVAWTYGTGAELQSVYDESREAVFTGIGKSAFEISKPDGWPLGIYHAEIFLDGEPVRTLSFTVR